MIYDFLWRLLTCDAYFWRWICCLAKVITAQQLRNWKWQVKIEIVLWHRWMSWERVSIAQWAERKVLIGFVFNNGLLALPSRRHRVINGIEHSIWSNNLRTIHLYRCKATDWSATDDEFSLELQFDNRIHSSVFSEGNNMELCSDAVLDSVWMNAHFTSKAIATIWRKKESKISHSETNSTEFLWIDCVRESLPIDILWEELKRRLSLKSRHRIENHKIVDDTYSLHGTWDQSRQKHNRGMGAHQFLPSQLTVDIWWIFLMIYPLPRAHLVRFNLKT